MTEIPNENLAHYLGLDALGPFGLLHPLGLIFAVREAKYVLLGGNRVLYLHKLKAQGEAEYTYQIRKNSN